MGHFICLMPDESRALFLTLLTLFYLNFNRKGMKSMNSTERRNKIKRVLFLRKHIKTAELARELGVSERTIRRDIELLSESEGIYTEQGRYLGGIYVMEQFNPYDKKVTIEEIDLLLKILFYIENVYVEVFSEQDVILYKMILKNRMDIQQ